MANNLCCPSSNVPLKDWGKLKDGKRIVHELEQSLSSIVLRMAREHEAQLHPTPARTTSYLTARDAKRDIAAYFGTLGQQARAPRRMTDRRSRGDMLSFFNELGQGGLAGLAPHPSSFPRVPARKIDVTGLGHAAAVAVSKLTSSMASEASRSARLHFEAWRARSMASAGTCFQEKH